MEIILERYERYSFAERQIQMSDAESTADWTTLEYAKLKARLEVLQKNQRHLMGEDLDTATLRDLQSLEQKLDSDLKHIRSKKGISESTQNHLMQVSVLELQKKDKVLQEQNNLLHKKLKEKENEMMSQQWQQQQQLRLYGGPNTSSSSSSILPHTSHSLSLSGSESGEVLQAEPQPSPLLPLWMDASHPELMTL